jgi:hypothetical protein
MPPAQPYDLRPGRFRLAGDHAPTTHHLSDERKPHESHACHLNPRTPARRRPSRPRGDTSRFRPARRPIDRESRRDRIRRSRRQAGRARHSCRRARPRTPRRARPPSPCHAGAAVDSRSQRSARRRPRASVRTERRETRRGSARGVPPVDSRKQRRVSAPNSTNMNRLGHTYDVIVVGSRCAGAATAMQLAQQSHDVLVVDRDDPPRHPVVARHRPAAASSNSNAVQNQSRPIFDAERCRR